MIVFLYCSWCFSVFLLLTAIPAHFCIPLSFEVLDKSYKNYRRVLAQTWAQILLPPPRFTNVRILNPLHPKCERKNWVLPFIIYYNSRTLQVDFGEKSLIKWSNISILNSNYSVISSKILRFSCWKSILIS